jgi:hypothetical protein
MTDELLKKDYPILYQIHQWILKAKELEYGEMEFVIKAHDYEARQVVMKAVKPKKRERAKSITKKVMIKKK